MLVQFTYTTATVSGKHPANAPERRDDAIVYIMHVLLITPFKRPSSDRMQHWLWAQLLLSLALDMAINLWLNLCSDGQQHCGNSVLLTPSKKELVNHMGVETVVPLSVMIDVLPIQHSRPICSCLGTELSQHKHTVSVHTHKHI